MNKLKLTSTLPMTALFVLVATALGTDPASAADDRCRHDRARQVSRHDERLP